MNSCAAVSGLILLVVTNLAAIISFATPYWLETSILTVYRNEGLWAKCNSQSCTWVFDSDGFKVSDEDFFIAVQGLMSVGLAVCLIALLIATLALCCQCKNCNHSGFVAGLLLTSFLCFGIAVAVFGIKYSEREVKISWDDGFTKFGWAYWLGVGSAGMALMTAIIYGCSSRESN